MSLRNALIREFIMSIVKEFLSKYKVIAHKYGKFVILSIYLPPDDYARLRSALEREGIYIEER
jgi:phosphatidylserine decarboxylase